MIHRQNSKAQSSVEFIIVVLFFIIVTIVLLTSYLDIFPAEVTKIKDQVACSRAEMLAVQLLELPGNDTDWNSTTNINLLGFTNDAPFEIDYNKFEYAKTKGYYNISQDANLSIPFRLSYDAYAINVTTENMPSELANESTPRAYIVRDNADTIIYLGSNSTSAHLSMKLFFPLSTVTHSACNDSELEAGDINTTISKAEGDEITLDWTVTAEDLDCINISMTRTTKLVFIKTMTLENTALGKTYPIYLNNLTILNNEIGSTGDIDPEKSYCSVERYGLLVNGGEKIPTKFQVLSWR
jgi:hypothetical protein